MSNNQNKRMIPSSPKTKNLLLIMLLATVTLLASCSQPGSSIEDGDSWEAVQERGNGTLVALYVPAEGFAYTGSDGRLTGVTVELMRDFGRFVSDTYQVDLDIQFVEETDWGVFYRKMVDAEDGTIGFGNVTITEARKQELVFSPPYMTNIASLITHADAPRLERLQDLGETLAGRSALAFEGTLHEQRLRALTEAWYPEANIEMAGTNDEILERVSAEDHYFAYIDLYNYWRASDRGMPLQRHEVADEAAEEFGYLMPLNTSWDAVITEYFERNGGLIHSSRYRNIMETHLGEDLATVLLKAGQE